MKKFFFYFFYFAACALMIMSAFHEELQFVTIMCGILRKSVPAY